MYIATFDVSSGSASYGLVPGNSEDRDRNLLVHRIEASATISNSRAKLHLYRVPSPSSSGVTYPIASVYDTYTDSKFVASSLASYSFPQSLGSHYVWGGFGSLILDFPKPLVFLWNIPGMDDPHSFAFHPDTSGTTTANLLVNVYFEEF